jgi:Ca2+/H+ antiporter, TMEM165/GDT1 family
LDAFITSTITVAIAEIGDKTQLLALLLAARFKNKTAIISGILLATLLNHFAAAWLGKWLITWLDPQMGSYLIAASFFAMAIWVLVPDKMDDDNPSFYRFGAFTATIVLFFMAEMGDKTQIATVILSARYESLTWVVIGTTLGMLIANVPVVIAGHFSAEKLPLPLIHRGCALLFALLGVATLIY